MALFEVSDGVMIPCTVSYSTKRKKKIFEDCYNSESNMMDAHHKISTVAELEQAVEFVVCNSNFQQNHTARWAEQVIGGY